MDKRYETVIFDLDGTLLNTIEDITDALNYSLRNNNFNYSIEINEAKYLVGSGVNILIERLASFFNINEDKIDCLKKDYLEKYVEIQKNKTKPYDGILKLLDEIKENKIKIGVISNKPQEDTERVIDFYFGMNRFDVIVGARKGVPIKPDPLVVFKTLEELDANKLTTIFIGDSDVDIKTAKNASLDSIGVLWGFRTKEDLEKENPKFLVDNTNTIKRILGI